MTAGFDAWYVEMVARARAGGAAGVGADDGRRSREGDARARRPRPAQPLLEQAERQGRDAREALRRARRAHAARGALRRRLARRRGATAPSPPSSRALGLPEADARRAALRGRHRRRGARRLRRGGSRGRARHRARRLARGRLRRDRSARRERDPRRGRKMGVAPEDDRRGAARPRCTSSTGGARREPPPSMACATCSPTACPGLGVQLAALAGTIMLPRRWRDEALAPVGQGTPVTLAEAARRASRPTTAARCWGSRGRRRWRKTRAWGGARCSAPAGSGSPRTSGRTTRSRARSSSAG